MTFTANTAAAQAQIATERQALKDGPDQSWLEDLPQRWADFRRAQIERQRADAKKLLELTDDDVAKMYGGATTRERIGQHAREQLDHLDIALNDVEDIASGKSKIADPYFCEGILRIHANAKAGGGDGTKG